MSGIHHDVAPWDARRQQLVNAHGVPRRWVDAPYPPGPLPVHAHLTWAVDGDEWVATRATAWTRSLVLVDIADTRWGLNAAWIPATDVRRAGVRG